MAYDGWLEFNGVELVNISRTAQLAEALGIDGVWVDSQSVAWIPASLGGPSYDFVENAPWFDSGYTPSGEFAGAVPLSFSGLDNDALESPVTEYVLGGGRIGAPVRKVLPIVASVALVGSTERGVEYGMRWLSKQLMGGNAGACSGGVLKYMRHAGYMTPRVHRRNVGLTRGLSVTQKRTGDCSTIWLVTFTLTAGESPEYSEPEFLLGDLGAPLATGPSVLSNGALPITYSRCPSYNYSPIYDPQNPALVAAPTPPNFYPSGWVPQDGTVMDRFWAKIKAPEPNTLPYVPIVTLRATDEAARMVRVSIYDAAAPIDSQCEALWTSTVSYLPPEQDLLIDGEERAAYVLMGNGGKRRADSLVFGPEASPIQWSDIDGPSELLVALDIGVASSGSTVRAALSTVKKSG